MTRYTRFIAATALAGAAALGIGGIAAAQDSDDGDLTVTEIQAPTDSQVLAQTDPTTPPDDSPTTDPAAPADDGATTDPPAEAEDDTNDGRGGRGGCDEDEGGTDDADAGSSTPVPAPADPTPAVDPAAGA